MTEKRTRGCSSPKPYPIRSPEQIGTGLATVKEAATYLCMSRERLYTMANRGEIPSYKIGSSRRFKLAELKAASIIDMRTLEWLANTLIDLQGGEIEKPSTFDDAEVPQEMIEEAAAHWGVTVKEVEQYVWDLHDRGAPYQFIKDYLRDIED